APNGLDAGRSSEAAAKWQESAAQAAVFVAFDLLQLTVMTCAECTLLSARRCLEKLVPEEGKHGAKSLAVGQNTFRSLGAYCRTHSTRATARH
ncbi:MAG TPA: hypothetical protein VGN98_01725, partial [Tianweitania sediminis]|nr:hypothetical protein [Tianweitania sediminis]